MRNTLLTLQIQTIHNFLLLANIRKHSATSLTYRSKSKEEFRVHNQPTAAFLKGGEKTGEPVEPNPCCFHPISLFITAFDEH